MVDKTVNTESILGEVVPNVYVDKVTLEAAGAPIENRNPHIDHPDETSAPTVGTSGMKIHLDVIIKETLDDTLVANWFNEVGFLKYLSIRAYQSHRVEDTEYVLDNQESLSDVGFLNKLKGRLKEKKISALHDKVLNDEATSNSDSLHATSSPTSASRLNQHYKYTDQDGNVIHDITYRITFEFANATPKHLAYFVFAMLDVEAIANDFNLNLSGGDTKSLSGKVASELIIDQFKTTSQSIIFRDPENQLWAGKVYGSSREGYYTLPPMRPGSVQLRRQTIPNYKIQDFRDLDNVDKLSITFEDIEANLLPDIDSGGVVNQLVRPADRLNKSVFTTAFLSRDPDSTCRFLFGIDFEKIVKNNSLFKAFFSNTSKEDLDRIKGLSRIREMKIIRRRVKGTGIEVVPFDLNSVEEIIALGGEASGGSFTQTFSDAGSISEINISHASNDRYRYFTGVDFGMRFITDGIYQYGVEFEVEDGTAEYLKSRLQQLYNTKTKLTDYLNLTDIPGNFDASANKFTQQFTTQVRNLYPTDKPWTDSIETYVSVLDVATSKKVNIKALTKKLYTIINPNTGNPRGIRFFISLIDVLTSEFQVILAANNVFPAHSNLQKKANGAFRKSGIPKTRKIRKFFKETYSGDVIKFTGYDFLATSGVTSNTNDEGLKVIDGADFIERAEKETLKYFPTLEQDIDFALQGVTSVTGHSLRDNSLSYFTPSRILMSGRKDLSLLVQGGGLNQDMTEYQEIVGEAIRINSGQKIRTVSRAPTPTTQTANTSVSSLSSLLTQAGATIVPRGISKKDLIGQPPPRVDPLTSEGIFGETKEGTDTFRKTEDKTQCEGAPRQVEFPTSVDVGAFMNKLVNVKLDLSLEKTKKTSNFPSPTVASSYDLNNPNNLVTRTEQLIVKEQQTDQQPRDQVRGRSEGISTASSTRPQERAARYENQDPETDCGEEQATQETESQYRSARQAELTARRPQTSISDSGQTAPTQTQGADQLTTTQALDLKLIPNQIYSQFLGSVNPSAVVNNFDDSENWIQRSANLCLFWQNYKNLVRVEVLVGYSSGRFGLSPARPMWRMMSYGLYQSSIGKNILCRIVPYNDPLSGVQTSPISLCDSGLGCTSESGYDASPRTDATPFAMNMSLPVFNTHFIIKPEDKGLSRSEGQRQTAPSIVDIEPPTEPSLSDVPRVSKFISKQLKSLESSVDLKTEFSQTNISKIRNK